MFGLGMAFLLVSVSAKPPPSIGRRPPDFCGNFPK
jgi:hypothetical protein